MHTRTHASGCARARVRRLSRCLHPIGIRFPSRGNSHRSRVCVPYTQSSRSTSPHPIALSAVRQLRDDRDCRGCGCASVRPVCCCHVTTTSTVATRPVFKSRRVEEKNHPCPPRCRVPPLRLITRGYSGSRFIRPRAAGRRKYAAGSIREYTRERARDGDPRFACRSSAVDGKKWVDLPHAGGR